MFLFFSVLFWREAWWSTSDQVLWVWTVMGWDQVIPFGGPEGWLGQTDLKWSLQTTALWWRCPQRSCCPPKWESRKAALVLVWKYIAVIQNANYMFSMFVCVGGIQAAGYSGLLNYNWTAIKRAPDCNLWPNHWLHLSGFTPLLLRPCCRFQVIFKNDWLHLEHRKNKANSCTRITENVLNFKVAF